MRVTASLGGACVGLVAALVAGGCDGQKQQIDLQGGLRPVKMELGLDGRVFNDALRVKVQLEQEPRHLGYRETLNVGSRELLVVHPGAGEAPVRLTGRPLRVEYLHVARLLIVHEGPKARKQVYYFAQPRRWFTVPREAPGSAPDKPGKRGTSVK